MIFYHSCYEKNVLIQNKNHEIHENRKQTFLTEQFSYEYIVMASFFFINPYLFLILSVKFLPWFVTKT